MVRAASTVVTTFHASLEEGNACIRKAEKKPEGPVGDAMLGALLAAKAARESARISSAKQERMSALQAARPDLEELRASAAMKPAPTKVGVVSQINYLTTSNKRNLNKKAKK